MPRPATGQVVEPKGKQKSWALRFRAYGKRRFVTLGKPEDGWNRDRAEAELRHVLADVERGIWQPYKSEPAEAPPEEPTFHEFASEWLASRTPELRPRTVEDYRWALSYHLLPFFRDHRISEISVEEVDRYRNAQVRVGRLSANSINRTIARLAQVLEVAVEYRYLDRNPARGRRRRLKGVKPRRQWLESEHVMPLLAAAGELDKEARRNDPGGRRAMLATLILAGLRVGELTALRWRDVDLANGRISVGDAKTDAGCRSVDMSPDLRDELATHKVVTAHGEDDAFVFTTNTGKPQDRNNVRRRVLVRAVELREREAAGERRAAAAPGPDASLAPTDARLVALRGGSDGGL